MVAYHQDKTNEEPCVRSFGALRLPQDDSNRALAAALALTLF
jgi:hypothetical protein